MKARKDTSSNEGIPNKGIYSYQNSSPEGQTMDTTKPRREPEKPARAAPRSQSMGAGSSSSVGSSDCCCVCVNPSGDVMITDSRGGCCYIPHDCCSNCGDCCANCCKGCGDCCHGCDCKCDCDCNGCDCGSC